MMVRKSAENFVSIAWPVFKLFFTFVVCASRCLFLSIFGRF